MRRSRRMHVRRCLRPAPGLAFTGDRGLAIALRIAGPHFVPTGYASIVDDDRAPGQPDDATKPARPAAPILSAAVPSTPASPAAPVDWSTSEPAAIAVSEIAPGIVLAGMGTRIAAFFVDLFILGCTAITVTLVVTSLIDDPATADLASAVVAAALGVAYFTVAWIGPWAATPGQRLAGLQVVDAATFQRIGVGQAVVRSLALGAALNLLSFAAPISRVIGAILIIWPFVLVASAIYDPRHQGLHDRWTRTLVVRRTGMTSFPLTLGCLLIGLIVLTAPLIMIGLGAPALREYLDQLPR